MLRHCRFWSKIGEYTVIALMNSRLQTFDPISISDHVDFKIAKLGIIVIPDSADEVPQSAPAIEFTSPGPKPKDRAMEGSDTILNQT